MPLYTYQPASAIAEIELCESESGGFRAYLTASAKATPEQLQAIKGAMTSQHDWVCLSHYRKGKPVLEVRGFEKPQDLEKALQDVKGIEGPARVTEMPSDKRSLWQRITNSTLKGSGFAYVVGDAAFMTYAGMELYGHYKGKQTADTIVKDVAKIEQGAQLASDAGAAALGELQKKHHVLDKLVYEDELNGKNISLTKEAFERIKEMPKSAKGSISGGWDKIISGIGYAIGSVILANYGSRDQAQMEIKNSVQKIDRFIRKEGLVAAEVDTILTQEQGSKPKGIFGRIDGILRRYPSEALNIVYTGVGLLLMSASFKQVRGLREQILPLKEKMKAGPLSKVDEASLQSLKKDYFWERIDIGLGSVTATSALAGLMITERKPVEGEKKPTSFLGRAWRWIQEQPLRATGYGYMIATGIHALATYGKWQPDEWQKNAIETLKNPAGVDTQTLERARLHKQDLMWHRKVVAGRGIFVALNVVAEFLMAFSSKGHGVGVKSDISIDDSVISATAEFIANQPKEKEELLIQRVAGYMASPDILDEKTDVIATKLREQIANYPTNPWSGPTAPAVAQTEPKLPIAASHAPSLQIQASKANSTRPALAHSLEAAAAPAI